MDYQDFTINYLTNTVCVVNACKSGLTISAPDADTIYFTWDEAAQIGNIQYQSGYASDVLSVPSWADEALTIYNEGV